jgi:SAF domain-containing protein
MAATETQSPAARRLRPPSWLDLRLVIGVLMVLVAVLVGARVVASSDKSTKVWSLAHDVSAGTKLTGSDLSEAKVRLFGSSDRYLSADTAPVGRVVNRDLGRGDLLPASALAPDPTGVRLPLAVDQDNTPPGLSHGDRIDVYVIPPASSSGEKQTQLVLSDAVVQSVSGLGGGGLAADNSKAQITVQIPDSDESDVVARLNTGDLYIVQRVGSSKQQPSH